MHLIFMWCYIQLLSNEQAPWPTPSRDSGPGHRSSLSDEEKEGRASWSQLVPTVMLCAEYKLKKRYASRSNTQKHWKQSHSSLSDLRMSLINIFLCFWLLHVATIVLKDFVTAPTQDYLFPRQVLGVQKVPWREARGLFWRSHGESIWIQESKWSIMVRGETMENPWSSEDSGRPHWWEPHWWAIHWSPDWNEFF